jgi:glycosyltransferase involved in cell wall biosynthesis
MRLAVVTTRHGARDDRIYYKEARSLARRYGHVYLLAPWSNEMDPWADESVTLVPLGSGRGPAGRIRALADAIRELRRIAPDVIHVHDFDLVFAIPLLRALTFAKLIYDDHEFFPESIVQERVPGRAREIARRALLAAEIACARCGDAVIGAVEPLTLRFLEHGCRAVTVFNYPRLELIEGAGREPPAWLAEIRENRTILLYQGTVSVDRGLLLMVDAMARLNDIVPKPLLVLVGGVTEEHRALAEAKIQENGTADAIRFVGTVNHTEIFSYVRASHVGLIPFLPVGQNPEIVPIKLFEYMACGVPTVAADLRAAAPYIRESGCGLLFEPGDAGALAEAIRGILTPQDPGYGALGREAVCEKWNWGRMEERLWDLYEDLVPALAEERRI